jgi:Domain of unknown function (DUF4276)
VASHLEILVEEPSAEAFLAAWLPGVLGEAVTFRIHAHQGKYDLLGKLEQRLRGYAKWLPESTRIIVLVDRDDEDCQFTKGKMEQAATAAGITSRTVAQGPLWRVVNRIAVEELEAWFFGAWDSVRRAYPKVAVNADKKAALRHSDEIVGGTWEAFERVMRQGGYFAGGLRKVEAAQAIGSAFDSAECRSPSFRMFHEAILEAVASNS